MGRVPHLHRPPRGPVELGLRHPRSRRDRAAPLLPEGAGGEGVQEPRAPGRERRRRQGHSVGEATADGGRGGRAVDRRGRHQGAAAPGRRGVLGGHAGPGGERVLPAVTAGHLSPVTDRADVVIVGGGVIGCACAHELARQGATVVLIERAELAAGASGRNHGLLLAPLDPIMVPMAAASTEVYEEVGPRAPLSLRLDPKPCGLLLLALDDDAERRAAAEEAEAAARCGVRIEPLAGEALRSFEPAIAPDFTDGWFLEDGRRLDPAALTVALALLARDLGADIRLHLTARSIVSDGRVARGVVTDAGVVRADTVVVAGWHTIPGEDRPSPIRAADLAEGNAAPFVSSLVQPNPDGTVLVGGSRQNAVTNEPEHPDVARLILRQAIGMLPVLRDSEVLSAWWGVRPMTPDGRPVVGFVKEGLLVATGHGSQGVILGAGTARLVASMAARVPAPFDPDPYAPERFGPGPSPVT